MVTLLDHTVGRSVHQSTSLNDIAIIDNIVEPLGAKCGAAPMHGAPSHRSKNGIVPTHVCTCLHNHTVPILFLELCLYFLSV